MIVEERIFRSQRSFFSLEFVWSLVVCQQDRKPEHWIESFVRLLTKVSMELNSFSLASHNRLLVSAPKMPLLSAIV
jgi:hypothetical protein